MFVFVPPPPPSREAEDLGERIAELIDQAIDENPSIDARDVRQALQIASSRLRGIPGGGSPGLITALGIGVILLVAGVAAYMQSQQGSSTPLSWVLVILGVIAAIGIAVVAIRASGGRR